MKKEIRENFIKNYWEDEENLMVKKVSLLFEEFREVKMEGFAGKMSKKDFIG